MTYFVAMPFVRNGDGELVAGEAQDRKSADAAESAAAAWRRRRPAQSPFSRTGDPATGEFERAVVLRHFGEVPSVEDLLSAGKWRN